MIRRTLEAQKGLFYSGYTKDYDGNIVKGEWPAILNIAVVEKANLGKDRRRTIGIGSNRPKYLLTGLGIFRCRFCESAVMIGLGKLRKNGTKQVYYFCSGSVWGYYRKILQNVHLIDKAWKDRQAEQSQSKAIERLEQRLSAIANKKSRLIMAVENETLPPDLVSSRIEQLQKEENEIRYQIDRLLEDDQALDLELLKKYFSIEELMREMKRKIIMATTNKIEFGKGSVYLNLRTKISLTEARIRLI